MIENAIKSSIAEGINDAIGVRIFGKAIFFKISLSAKILPEISDRPNEKNNQGTIPVTTKNQ